MFAVWMFVGALEGGSFSDLPFIMVIAGES